MIRLANSDDTVDICALIKVAVNTLQGQGICQWDSAYPSRSIVEADISMGSLYVLEDLSAASYPIGFVTIDEQQDPLYSAIKWSSHAPSLVVHRLTIHPQYQGKGLGTQMMQFAEGFCVLNGYTSIRLDAFAQNKAACTLYEGRGYAFRGMLRNRMGLFNCYEKML